jgi:hypothetical protein
MAQEDNKIILEKEQDSIGKWLKVYDNFMPIEKLAKFLQFCNSDICQEYWMAGKVGDRGDGGTIKKETRLVDCLGLTNIAKSYTAVHYAWYMKSVVTNLLKKYVDDTNAQIFDFRVHDIEVLRYGVGGKYEPHIDASLTYPRRVSMILLLNNDYEGGELYFPGIGEIKVAPNRAIVWPSNYVYVHGVKPITKGTRYSIVSWLL